MRTNLISILPVDSTQRKAPPAPPANPPDGRRPSIHVIDSTQLLQGHGEVVITHNGREYRLRLTRLGKLILTA